MCSEDDLYDPQFLETMQFYNVDTEDEFFVPHHITMTATYALYHRRTVRWMVDIENRNNCKLIISTYTTYIIFID